VKLLDKIFKSIPLFNSVFKPRIQSLLELKALSNLSIVKISPGDKALNAFSSSGFFSAESLIISEKIELHPH
tara:strand:- start:1132 stop:1347 length:216 start_codon:yes stop_codon:yes gene_type:complete